MSAMMTSYKPSYLDGVFKMAQSIAADGFKLCDLLEGSSDAKLDAQVLSQVMSSLKYANAEALYKYLTRNDGVNMTQIAGIVKACVKDVLNDNALQVDDVPRIVRMILDIIKHVNAYNIDAARAPTPLQAVDMTILLKTIVTLVLHMALPAEQYGTMLAFIEAQFDMVQVHVLPVVQENCGCPWFGFK